MAKAQDKAQRRLTPHWRSRIVGHARVDPRKLKANPNNWRVHPEIQTRAMRDALDQLGVLSPIIVNKRSGRVVDGHMRRELAIDNDEEAVDVTYVELTEDEENLALSIMNPMGELGAVDPEKLGDLLSRVSRGDASPLDELLQSLEEQAQGASVKAAAPTEKGKRGGATHQTTIMRMMLENPEVATIERAIASTGLMNRGEALLAICRHFLGKDNAKGQLDAATESSPADQLAQALAAATSGAGKPRRPRSRVGDGVSKAAAGSGVRSGSIEGGDPLPPAADVERLPGEGGAGPQ